MRALDLDDLGRFHSGKSSARAIFWGNLWVDPAATRDCGMPPGAYCGFDSQSDAEAALFLNPFFLTTDVVKIQVPWPLKGMLVQSLVHALLHGSVMHRRLSVEERCENAMTALAALDLAKALSHDVETKNGWRKGSAFLPVETMRNSQQLAGFICSMCRSVPENMPLRPWCLTEGPMEQFFGLLRSQQPSMQLNVRCLTCLTGHARIVRKYLHGKVITLSLL